MALSQSHTFIQPVKLNVLVQISVNRLLPLAPRLSSPLFITVKVYGFYCGQITAARGRRSFLSFPSLCWGPLVFMSFIVQSQGLYPELPTLMRLMYQIQQHTHKHEHTPMEGKKKEKKNQCSVVSIYMASACRWPAQWWACKQGKPNAKRGKRSLVGAGTAMEHTSQYCPLTEIC